MDNNQKVLVFFTNLSGGSITLGAGSQFGIQDGSASLNHTISSNIVLNAATGAANAAQIGGFSQGNATNITSTISGTGDLRWVNNILGGGTNSATLTAGSNTTGWAANSYVGATSLEGVNLNFNLTSNAPNGTVTPFGATGNTATINGGATFHLTQSGGTSNITTIANAINFAAVNSQTTTFFRDDGDQILSGPVDISTAGTGKVVLKSRWGAANTKGLELTGMLTGSGNLTITRTADEQGTVHLGNNGNTYSGTVTVDNSGGAGGILVLDANGAATSAAINLASSGSHLNVNATNATIASLTGVTGSQVSARTAGQTLTVNQAGNTTFAGVIGGTGITGAVSGINLVKSGAGALTLTGSNTYTGGTTVSGGILALNAADADGTGLVAINSGTVQTNLNNALGSSAAKPSGVTLGGGTLQNTLLTAGSAANNVQLAGTLTLAAGSGTSTLDFGANGNTLNTGATFNFAGYSYTSGTLNVANWTGLSGGGGTDQFTFTTAPTSVANIYFVNPTVGGTLQSGTYLAMLAGNEVVPGNIAPTPEPGSLIPIVIGMAGLGVLIARKRRKPNTENCQNELAEAV